MTPSAPDATVPPAGPHHLAILAAAAGVVLAALVLEVRADDRVALRSVPARPFPATCASRTVLGIPCPLCGLTRSVVHLAHGDWAGSVASHRLGGLVALAILAQIPYRLAWLRLGRPPLGTTAPRLLLQSFIAALAVNWAVELWTRSRAG